MLQTLNRWTRVLRKWAVPPFLALLVTIALMGFLEVFAWLAMRITHPVQARHTLQRHAVLGNPKAISRGELPLRKILQKLPFHPLHGWFARTTQKSRDRYGFRVNSRSETTALDPSADYRIFLVGGSTVLGPNVPPQKTIPAYLERRLDREVNVNVDVINAGVGGYNSANELSFLSGQLLPFFNPDLVVVMDGVNDAGANVDDERFSLASNRHWPSAMRTPYLHPVLVRYRRQVRSMWSRPGFVINQFLSVLGVRHYFVADNYFLGQAIQTLVEDEPYRTRSVRDFQQTVETVKQNAQINLTDSVRRRARHRLQQLDRTERRSINRILEQWTVRDRTILLKILGSLESERWNRTVRRLPRSEKALRRNLKRRVKRFQPEALSRVLKERECRNPPVDVMPYVSNLRSMAAAARVHDIPMMHALQPIVAYKRPKTFAERQMMIRTKIGNYVTPLVPGYTPLKTCFVRLFERFYSKARHGIRSLPVSTGPSVTRLDLSRLFENQPRHIFFDSVHYNARGNRIIAETMARRIIRHPGFRSLIASQE